MTTYRCWAEIDLNALKQNLHSIRTLVGENKTIMTVVKADAYGHGLEEIATHLMNSGTDAFAVANLNEAHHIRRRGSNGWPILMLGACSTREEREYAIRQQVMMSVSRPEEITAIAQIVQQLNQESPAMVQIKVDTGMGRLGVTPGEVINLVRHIQKLSPYVEMKGIFTHLAAAEDDVEFTANQLCTFKNLLQDVARIGIVPQYTHASSSGGILLENNDLLNTVRPGLIIYGITPEGKRPQPHLELIPALSFYCRVSLVKEISAGTTISYGHTFTAPRTMRVATITAGYGDGYHRAATGKASVLIHGMPCPILGRITMDQMIVDVSHLDGVKMGDPVVLIGKQGTHQITATQLAEWAGTIPWEVLTSISYRVQRIYTGTSAS